MRTTRIVWESQNEHFYENKKFRRYAETQIADNNNIISFYSSVEVK